MIAAVRGNITNLRVNFTGSRPATKLLAAEATWATGLSTNLCSIPVLPIAVVPIKPANLLDRVRETPPTHLGNKPPAPKSP
jgi:hypothetical protein